MPVEQNIEHPEKEFIYVPVPQAEQPRDEEGMDILEYWNIIWKGKWFVMGLTLLCTLVAVYRTLYVLPVIYKSDVVLQPTETKSLSGLSALAANLPMGFSLGGGTGGKTDSIISFLNSRTINERLIEKYDLMPKLYSKIWDKENQKWLIENPEDKPTMLKAIKKLKNGYQINKNRETALITISWIDKDPEFTKIMLQRIVKEIRYYFENEYESNAKKEREFVENQLNKAEKELEHWERQVPTGKLTLSKIQRENFVSQTVYTELRKQLELSKISEVKEIINFKILDQPFVPEKRFKPDRRKICIRTFVVSGFVSIFLLFFRQFVINLKTKTK